MSNELKPCPFCGGAGNLIGAHEDCEGYFTEARVECPNCRFEIVGDYRQTKRGWATESDYINSEKTAVDRWNRRTIKGLYSSPTIKTKQVKYFDEDEKVWKIGEVIVNSSERSER